MTVCVSFLEYYKYFLAHTRLVSLVLDGDKLIYTFYYFSFSAFSQFSLPSLRFHFSNWEFMFWNKYIPFLFLRSDFYFFTILLLFTESVSELTRLSLLSPFYGCRRVFSSTSQLISHFTWVIFECRDFCSKGGLKELCQPMESVEGLRPLPKRGVVESYTKELEKVKSLIKLKA